MLDLLIVRHAIAHERDRTRWPDDRLRPLTQEGEKRFRRAACGIARMIERPDRVLTSPLVRARRTAEILHEFADWPEPIDCEELAPGCPPAESLERVRELKARRTGVVGHDPQLSELLAACISRPAAKVRSEFRKGGLARVCFEDVVRGGRGTLLLFVPPRLLRALG